MVFMKIELWKNINHHKSGRKSKNRKIFWRSMIRTPVHSKELLEFGYYRNRSIKRSWKPERGNTACIHLSNVKPSLDNQYEINTHSQKSLFFPLPYFFL